LSVRPSEKCWKARAKLAKNPGNTAALSEKVLKFMCF